MLRKTKRGRNPWSEEEDAILRERVVLGDNPKEILKWLPDRSFYAIKKRIADKKVHGKFWCKKRFAEMVKFKMAGWTQGEIARVFNLPKSTVSYMFRKKGLIWFCDQRKPPSGKTFVRWTELELHRLRSLLQYYHRNGGISSDVYRKIQIHFKNRSVGSIEKKSFRMIRYWLSADALKEREVLLERYKKRSTVDWS